MPEKNGYVTIGTFEEKLWNIKGDVDNQIEKRKQECKSENDRIYQDTAVMKTNIMANNKCVNDLRNDMAQVKNDVDWLKRFFWIVTVSSIGALVTGVINLVVI